MKERSPITKMPFHTMRQFKHIFKGQVPRHEFVDKTIVEGIIREIYFYPEDKESVKEGALSIFQKQLPVLQIYH